MVHTRTAVFQFFLHIEGSATYNVCPSRETADDDRVVAVDVR